VTPSHTREKVEVTQTITAAGQTDQRYAGGHLWPTICVCATLILIVWMAFGQTRHFEFVNYDDGENVYENAQVTAGLSTQGIAWAFTHNQVGNWIPLTTVSHMIDCQFYKLWAGGHHLTNLLLHALAAIVLFLALRQMAGDTWRSAFLAVVFAIHPLRVESVAWISERKDVLSGVFFMLTLWAYAQYATRPTLRSYAAVAISFCLGLLSKPMLVTTPFVLLLLDYWPLARFRKESLRRLLLEKAPFIAISAALCLVTLFSQRQTIAPIDRLPLSLRLGNALVSYNWYLWKSIYPAHLAVLYPLSKQGWSIWQVLVSALLLAGSTAAAFCVRRRLPFLLVGWLWYVGMLVPVIGLIQVGAQAYADRYTYLPQIGLCLAATWTATNWLGKKQSFRIALGMLGAGISIVLVMAASRQTTYWRNSEALWAQALNCTKDNDVAHNNLGNTLLLQNRTEEALLQYREAVRINPDYAYAQNNLAHLLFQLGEPAEAKLHYAEAVRSDPESTAIRIRFGMDLFQLGQVSDAIAQFQEAVHIDPDCADAHTCLGNVSLFQGQPERAAAEYRETLRINPADPMARSNLNLALGMLPKGNERK
jgi:tetratricopeptide (TPR) repeat protein